MEENPKILRVNLGKRGPYDHFFGHDRLLNGIEPIKGVPAHLILTLDTRDPLLARLQLEPIEQFRLVHPFFYVPGKYAYRQTGGMIQFLKLRYGANAGSGEWTVAHGWPHWPYENYPTSFETILAALEDEPFSDRSSVQSARSPKVEQKPAVPVKDSVQEYCIVCLEDGIKFKSLKQHLRMNYDLSPEEYREKWGLPRDYPMIAPAYAAARSELAKRMGFVRRGAGEARAAVEPEMGKPTDTIAAKHDDNMGRAILLGANQEKLSSQWGKPDCPVCSEPIGLIARVPDRIDGREPERVNGVRQTMWGNHCVDTLFFYCRRCRVVVTHNECD
jgi:predicted transcriptional regulator